MTKVIILGGGFGGVFTAKHLKKIAPPDTDIRLISENNYFTFQPLLPEVAAGAIGASDSVTPLRVLLPGVRTVMGEVRAIDLARKNVDIVQGSKRRIKTMTYDHLVLALGQVVHLSRVPGLEEHAFPIKHSAHALRLRNHVINCLEYADSVDDPQIKARLLTFVVVGAGFSGVETVGEIKDMIDRSLKFYPNIAKADVRTVLVEFSDRILGELPEKLANYAQERLARQGIDVWLNTAVKSASATTVEMADGRILTSSTVVATIGNGPSPLIEALDIEKERGRLKVDRFMRIPGVDGAWAVGDAALIPLTDTPEGPRDYAPPTAQFAVREGQQLAANVAAQISGAPLKAFHYVPRGAMASIGNYRAVASTMGVQLHGVLAWLLWRTFYLGMLPGAVTKLRVVLNWALDLFAPRNLGQVQEVKKPSAKYMRFSEGQEVFEPGMIPDGFYTIVSGSCRLEIPRDDGGAPYRRDLKVGDHFGERVLFRQQLRTGRVTALEDSRVLRVQRDDFWRLSSSFPMLEKYFKNYIAENFPEDLRPHVLGGTERDTKTPPKS
ncbi:FAD-dependent oxidoreductase [Varunaivibrio sulfuroxidans]|uniref:NADH:ubiquinone reductase (non-electrogenic) n=1 Tax=Varunaivibrio sulfuroxidans TaxID=1773489 RepID=A0A4R3JFN2_9PROT|nr:FAD-dependent oxidoreductase [Varunaivibrio sulfuroxidans]TCS64938.1 NADH dehydrogenase [Varunaivibrio sulfuroxidans]WES29770.1 FAD-dependent oxidoreductase [Varunaivibrio sulfuroxidans]